VYSVLGLSPDGGGGGGEFAPFCSGDGWDCFGSGGAGVGAAIAAAVVVAGLWWGELELELAMGACGGGESGMSSW